MWRFIKVFIVAIFIFIIVNFFLSNSSPQANSLASLVSFKFNLPPFGYYESIDFPIGYLLIISFTIGMFFSLVIGGLTSWNKTREIKNQNKILRELEHEIEELREALQRERHDHEKRFTSFKSETNQLPEEPEIS